MSKKIWQLTQTTSWLFKYRKFIAHYARKDLSIVKRVDPWELFNDLKLLRQLHVNEEELTCFMSRMVSTRYKYTYNEMAPILQEILLVEIQHLGPINTILNKLRNANRRTFRPIVITIF